MLRKQFVWVVIYLNLPLWVAVGILAFGFQAWGTVKVLVGVNAVALLVGYILYPRDTGGEDAKT